MVSTNTKEIKFFGEDLTLRREGAKVAKEEKEKGFKKSFIHKMSYPEAQRYNKELTNNNSAFFAPLCLCVMLFPILLLSCQSVPKTVDAFFANTNSLPLEAGATLYIFADVKDARSIINMLPIVELKDDQTRQMLDRTDFFAAALFPRESRRRFQIAAFGNYPSSQVDIALSVNKDWEKKRSQAGGSYWYSNTNRLSLAISSKQAFAASSLNDEPFDPLAAATSAMIPKGFAEFRKIAAGSQGAPLSCWLENPARLIQRFIDNIGLPINLPVLQLFINIYRQADDQYDALIRLQFENESQARTTLRFLSLASNFIGGNTGRLIASVFLANPPVLNGSNIDIRTTALSEAGIIQILSLFPDN